MDPNAVLDVQKSPFVWRPPCPKSGANTKWVEVKAKKY